MFVLYALTACAVLSLFVTAQQGGVANPQPAPGSPALSTYPGFAALDYAFIFGDSYTTIGFNTSGEQPTPGNPLGNPPYPGSTSSDGLNWVDYLTTQYNESLLLTYDLAVGGATVDNDLVSGFMGLVPAVKQQIEDEFIPLYAPSYVDTSAPGSKVPAPTGGATPNWTSNNTLFAIFIGINDVGSTYRQGTQNDTVLNNEIFSVFLNLANELYKAGGRNFLFLNVPAVNRSPLTVGTGADATQEEFNDIKAWNIQLSNTVGEFYSTHSDTNNFIYDTNTLFNRVLDDPKIYPQTSQITNRTDYCVAYENGTPTQDYFNVTCGVPVNQYFWLNSLHPTFPIQDVLAQQVANLLNQEPNMGIGSN